MNLRPNIDRYVSSMDQFVGRMFSILMWKNVFVFSAGLFLLYILAYSTQFHRVLSKDAFFYVNKGMEIANGDFQLFHSHAVGWPVFLGFFYKILGVENIFQGMFVARWLSILLFCVVVFPISALCKKVCGHDKATGACILAVTVYVVSPQIQSMAQFAYTEPLFLLLTLYCYYFLVNNHPLRKREIVLASLLASLSYWVRANGLFQLFVILGMIVFWSRYDLKYCVKRGLLAIVVFFTVSAPHLIMRFMQFGSPFDYGPNSKYFVDNFSQVWDDNVPVPTFVDYLTTHNWYEYYNKFIDNGLWQVLKTLPLLFLNQKIWLILLALAFIVAAYRRKQEMYPLMLMMLLTLAGFALVFDVFGHVRHLIFLIPFIIICCGFFLDSMDSSRWKISNILILLLLVYTVSNYNGEEFNKSNRFTIPEVKDTWALWVADNLEGNVAVLAGGDLLRMSQHYEQPAINLVPLPFAEARQKINRIRIKSFDSLAEALVDFKEQNVKYVITDSMNSFRRPFLRDINQEKWQNSFEHMKYFEYGNSGARLSNVNVYRIRYEELENQRIGEF